MSSVLPPSVGSNIAIITLDSIIFVEILQVVGFGIS